jgi:hypothetical protein
MKIGIRTPPFGYFVDPRFLAEAIPVGQPKNGANDYRALVFPGSPMNFFVLIYDRSLRQLVELREFSESKYTAAEAYRLRAQLHALRDELDQDVVLFQAVSRDALRRTHGSYFFSESELLERIKRAAEVSEAEALSDRPSASPFRER